MIDFIVRLLPSGVIRFFGRLQFQIPLLRPIINRVAQHAISGEGTIQRGEGEGLRFDATGCNPGYLIGTSGPQEQEILTDILDSGDVLYNLGAHAGFYAVIAAREVGPEGHVYAFEPTPELAERTRHNANLNGFQQVEVVEAAVCNQNEVLEFGSEGFDVTNSLKKATEGNAIKVQGVKLDSWATGKRPPDLILMDIEGAELDALRGAEKLLRQYRPVMIIEVHWLGEKFRAFVERKLKPLGYEVATLSGGPLPTEKTERYHSLLTTE